LNAHLPDLCQCTVKWQVINVFVDENHCQQSSAGNTLWDWPLKRGYNLFLVTQFIFSLLFDGGSRNVFLEK
jgi:hypothetical protein